MTTPTDGSQYRNLAPPTMDDLVDTVLNQGLVVDAFWRASLTGLEVSTVDGRTIVANLDTYLRLARAVERPPR